MSVPFRLVTSSTPQEAQPINPCREPLVDLQVAAYTPILDGAALGTVPAFGMIAPGDVVGDELVIRVLPRNAFSDNFEDLTLVGQPQCRELNFEEPVESSWVPMFEDPYDSGAQGAYLVLNFTPPAPATVRPATRPALIILRWTGCLWLVVSKTLGWSVSTPA